MLRFKLGLTAAVLLAALLLPGLSQAQFRNNGIYLPQLGYMSLSLINGDEKFGASDAGFFGVGGLNSIGYNFWVTYRLWVGFSAALGDHSGSDVLVTVNAIPGIRYNFLDEEFRPYAELGFHTMWFPYTEGSNVPVNPIFKQAMFGAPRPAVGFEWYFYEEMSVTAEVAYHLYLTIGSFIAHGVSGMVGYTVYY